MTKLFVRWFRRNFSNPQSVILAVILLFLFLGLWLIGPIIMPLLVAVVIAYLLEWAVSAMQKSGLPRNAAVVLVFVGFVTISLTIVIGIIPLVGRQLESLFSDLPSMASRINSMLMALPEKYPDYVTKEQLEDFIQKLGGNFGNIGDVLVSFSLASFKNIVSVLIYMILVPLLVFFFLKDKDKILTWFLRWLPDERQLSTRVWQEVDGQIGAYARGKVVEIFIVGLVSYISFVFFGLNYALLLGVLVGFSVLIPYIGATIVTIPVALVALIQWGPNDTFLYLIITYFIIQALDGNVLVPLLFSEANNLHPVAIIAAVLFFGGIWGFWGVFFAIPLATLVVAVLDAWDEAKSVPEIQSQAS
ncbi:AI-2E family transporter [Aliikangiella coralliicola]|uniref:AI-2E family transporter n=1 Tax=Aliikangiella coralliicola TaxID=2592383 RepID=A0A545U8J9_9GAMM|nr:AI-2E family transporter [Aliikangiella coralliicola]TQV85791.1 AI-2E family transporter [Aliikangiella coralliicola]